MVITVECTSCHTGFPVDSKKIPEGGVSVRCSACASIFRVEPVADEPPVALEFAEQPVADEPPVAPESPEAPVADEVPFAPQPEAEAASEAPQAAGAGDGDAADYAGAEEPGATEAAASDPGAGVSDWVIERDEDLDPDALTIDPVGTVEETVSEASDESSFFGGRPSSGGAAYTGNVVEPQDPPAFGAAEESLSFDSQPSPDPPAAAEPVPSPPVTGFTFGQRDPREKAQRLARVLVSDMIMYNPDRHERALANGTLRDDFEEEIAKSWKEYVDQVGDEMAESTDFWTEALNDVLAKGERVF